MITPRKAGRDKKAQNRGRRPVAVAMGAVFVAAAIAAVWALAAVLTAGKGDVRGGGANIRPRRETAEAAPAPMPAQAQVMSRPCGVSDAGALRCPVGEPGPRTCAVRFTNTTSAMWRVYHNKGPVVTNGCSEKYASLSARVFRSTADKYIGQLVSIEPGTVLHGPPVKYDERFVRSFLRSLDDPIVIVPGDTEEVAALKRAVRETRADLKARYDAGEDIARIMTDTRKELQQLGMYRDELQKELNRIVGKGGKDLTDEELQGYVDAANRMLAERGAKPVALPGLMRRRVRMRLGAGGVPVR